MMFAKAFTGPLAFTAAVTAASVGSSIVVATIAMLIAGYDDFLFAYGLAGGIPAIAAPLTIYPLVSANRRLRAMQAKLESLALTDVLTGLPNRRGFFERADQIFEQATDTGASIAAMMVDIDRFKSVNDTHGHNTGDMVLAAVARTIRDAVVGSGAADSIVARLGGEEFAIIVMGLQPSAVARLADQIGRDARRVEHRHGGGVIMATVSIGVSLRRDSADVDAVLKAADDAVYAAKHAGRDRWSFTLGEASEFAVPVGFPHVRSPQARLPSLR
jgi:diguanylate cyclase (GGDEF)-like protein